MYVLVATDIPPRIKEIHFKPVKTFKSWEVRDPENGTYQVKYWDIKWLGLHFHMNNERD